MKPVAAIVAASLLSGAAMFTAGTRTARLEAFTTEPVGQSAQLVAEPIPIADFRSADPQIVPVSSRRNVPSKSRSAASQNIRESRQDEREIRSQRDIRDEREVRDDADNRTWTKSALIIGGAAASGAGVGGAVKGKKGALIGAAIGGGAASIYEATQRR